ncbi:ENDO3 [Arabidopsis thaliana]|uniref:ENDO3 n=1 Tax=Arabidopsis thaliana TaxID=3702 RepID=A0A178UZU8_ARATH|nr:ENDO3 [Arabidopsis thaliana]
MGWSLRMWIVSILVLTQLVNGALCWGDAGHYAVCKIAQVKISLTYFLKRSSKFILVNDLCEYRSERFRT